MRVILGYSYDLTKAQGLWLGKQRAIFYINKFCFLSESIPNSYGFYAQEYALSYDQEWNMSFSIKVNGDFNSQKDGFVFAIQENKSIKFMQQNIKESQLVDQNLIGEKGIFLWLSGEKFQLNVGQNINTKNPSEINAQQCSLENQNESIHIYIQKQQETIRVYYHQGVDQQYKLCAELKNEFSLKELFVSMAAKSSLSSKLSFHLTQFYANLDKINSNIDQQNTHQNEDISKLFHGIYLNLPEETADKIELGKNVQVSDLYINEKKIEENLKQSLNYLKNTLTSAQAVKDYFQYHKSLRKEQKLNVLQDIDRFLDLGKNTNTGDQNDLQSIKQDERSKGLYQTAQKIKSNIQKLVSFYESNQNLFYQLKEAHQLISDNIEFIENWNQSHQNFSNSLEILHNRITYNHTYRANKSLAIIMAIFGVFIVSVLGLILHRVSSTNQVSIKV